MKKRYIIAIEETVVQKFEVFAEDGCKALETAEQKYKNGEIALVPKKSNFRQMAVVSDNEPTEWMEF